MRKTAIAIIVAGLICACATPPSDDPPSGNGYGQVNDHCVSQLPPAERAAAIAGWVGGALPPSVDGDEDCAFYDFAWQSFLALTAGGDGDYVFTRWGSSEALFPPPGEVPPPFPGNATTRLAAGPQLGKHAAAEIADPDRIPADDLQQAASLVPLTDQHGRWVHYTVLTNEIEYELIREQGLYASDCYNAWGGTTDGEVSYDPAKREVTVTCTVNGKPVQHTCATDVAPDPMPQLPAGAIELKVAWRVLETCTLQDSPKPCTPEDPSPYLTVPGTVAPYSPTVPRQEVTLGLVGLHIVTRTATHPDGIWATFEQRGNAPDCPAVTAPTGQPWSLQGKGGENMFCTPCPVPLASWPQPFRDKALQQAQDGEAILIDDDTRLACTSNPGAFNLATPALYDPGTGDAQCPGAPIPTEVCREVPIPPVVAQLNGWVDEVLAQKSPVLANYELVGVMWLDESCRADAGCTEQGTPKLTNTTMETFEQGLDLSQFGGGTGCLVCHSTNDFNPNPYPAAPFARGLADRSLAFFRIRQTEGTGCDAPPATYHCPPCRESQARLLVGH